LRKHIYVDRSITTQLIEREKTIMPLEDNRLSCRVMTYNIRMDTIVDGENRWCYRRQRILELIQRTSPDLLGVQEPMAQQMSDLRAGLSDYGSCGVARDDGKDQGEYSAIFYRHRRYELIDQGTFWLSEYPHIPGSKGWDAVLPRICTWARLFDRISQRELFHFNTHYDHQGIIATRESSRLILSFIEKITASSSSPSPVILAGDLNSDPQSDAYRCIINNTSFQDAQSISTTGHSGPSGTWSTFQVKTGIGPKIDYIFVTPLHFQVMKHQHLIDSENNLYPSDHLPVIADLVFC
jgi:endonuclease/exonuclease/phosphatase family metal-dependent hydrolase